MALPASWKTEQKRCIFGWKSVKDQAKRGCGQKVGHSGVRIGVRMYPLETRELAVEAVAAGFSLTEAAELAGC
ncbi:hypothetical protein, partial [Rubneribacter badeniensis]|uniref:hypothetical protein n=1 Tax=Rubneribacter badeniensis TaxID=2070688 RepID=UPI003A9015B9